MILGGRTARAWFSASSSELYRSSPAREGLERYFCCGSSTQTVLRLQVYKEAQNKAGSLVSWLHQVSMHGPFRYMMLKSASSLASCQRLRPTRSRGFASPEEPQLFRCLQLDQSGFPSNMKPILVADAAVCAELASLEAELESVGPPGSDARKQAEAAVDAFVHDLGWVLGCRETGEGRGKLSDPLLCSRLLAFTMEHGWLHTTGRILDAMAAARKGQMGNGHVAEGEEKPSGQPSLAAQDLGVGRIRRGAIANKEVVCPEAKEEEPERGLRTNNEGGPTEAVIATPQSGEQQSQRQSPRPRSSGLSDTPLGLLRSTGLGQQPAWVNLLTWHDSKPATTTNFGVTHLGVQEQEPLRTTPALCAAVTSAKKFSRPGDHSPRRLTLPQQASHGAMQQNGSGYRSSGLSDKILLWAVGTFGDIKTSANLHATWASEKLQGALLDCAPGPAWDANGSKACQWSFHQAGCSAHDVLSGKDTKAKPFLVPSC
jgi:hypothetical protein